MLSYFLKRRKKAKSKNWEVDFDQNKLDKACFEHEMAYGDF